MMGVTPSGSGCQPSASAAYASSRSDIPNAKRKRTCQRDRKRKRQSLELRYGRHCWLCNGIIRTHEHPTLDHVVPLSKGGLNAMTNLRLAHKRCNERRGDGPPPVLELTERMKLTEETA